MKNKHLAHIINFKPPLLLSCLLMVVFATFSVVILATELHSILPAAVIYVVYICAALSLALAVWAIVNAVTKSGAKKKVMQSIQRLPLAERLICDYSYRTVAITYISFGATAVLAVSKGIAGWFSGSFWLITFAVYYLVLCVAKLLLLLNNRKLSAVSDDAQRLYREWTSYGVCGVILILLTVVLQGMVVLIVKDGSHFTYYGVLIFAVALYDFSCLTVSIVYMVRNRKKHSPIIVAIKSISFAASLVSMLSLQTAMFASFGNDGETEMQGFMNLLVGSGVCLIILSMGIFMVIRSHKKLKSQI